PCQTNERPRQAGAQSGGGGTQAQRRGDTAHLRGREAAEERAPCQETPGVKPPLRRRRDVIFPASRADEYFHTKTRRRKRHEEKTFVSLRLGVLVLNCLCVPRLLARPSRAARSG